MKKNKENKTETLSHIINLFTMLVGIVGLIGVIATVIGVYVTMTQPATVISFIQDTGNISTSTPIIITEIITLPTQTFQPTYTPYPLQPTYTPYPLRPTYTPYPTLQPTASSTPPTRETTHPDSILEIGDTWMLTDRSLTLERCEFTNTGGNGSRAYLKCTFKFENLTSSKIFFQVNSNNFLTRTNTGVEDSPWTSLAFTPFYRGEELSVSAGSFEYLKPVPLVVDYYDSSITSVLIFAKNLGNISQATWQINIPH